MPTDPLSPSQEQRLRGWFSEQALSVTTWCLWCQAARGADHTPTCMVLFVPPLLAEIDRLRLALAQVEQERDQAISDAEFALTALDGFMRFPMTAHLYRPKTGD